MRKITFRGKVFSPNSSLYPQNWVKGFYLQDVCEGKMRHFIKGKDMECEVDPATIGQFTGFYDRDEAAIFEGDICSVKDSVRAEVLWQNGGFHLVSTTEDVYGTHTEFAFSRYNNIKVIGNIYDESK